MIAYTTLMAVNAAGNAARGAASATSALAATGALAAGAAAASMATMATVAAVAAAVAGAGLATLLVASRTDPLISAASSLSICRPQEAVTGIGKMKTEFLWDDLPTRTALQDLFVQADN